MFVKKRVSLYNALIGAFPAIGDITPLNKPEIPSFFTIELQH
jgi:hypothetical protein